MSLLLLSGRPVLSEESAPPWFLPTEIESLKQYLETPVVLHCRGLSLKKVFDRLSRETGLGLFPVSPPPGSPGAGVFSRILQNDRPRLPLRDHLYSLCRQYALSANWILKEGRIRGVQIRPFTSAPAENDKIPDRQGIEKSR